MGIISKNVARQPKLSIILVPITRSITVSTDNIELNIPCATATFPAQTFSYNAKSYIKYRDFNALHCSCNNYEKKVC